MSRDYYYDSRNMSQSRNYDRRNMERSSDYCESRNISPSRNYDRRNMPQKRDYDSRDMSRSRNYDSRNTSKSRDYDSRNTSPSRNYDHRSMPQKSDYDHGNMKQSGDYDFRNMAQKRSYDHRNMEESSNYDSKNTSQSRDYDSRNTAEYRDYDRRNMEQSSNYDRINMEQSSNYDSRHMARDRNYDPRNMPQKGYYDPRNMPQKSDYDQSSSTTYGDERWQESEGANQRYSRYTAHDSNYDPKYAAQDSNCDSRYMAQDSDYGQRSSSSYGEERSQDNEGANQRYPNYMAQDSNYDSRNMTQDGNYDPRNMPQSSNYVFSGQSSSQSGYGEERWQESEGANQRFSGNMTQKCDYGQKSSNNYGEERTQESEGANQKCDPGNMTQDSNYGQSSSSGHCEEKPQESEGANQKCDPENMAQDSNCGQSTVVSGQSNGEEKSQETEGANFPQGGKKHPPHLEGKESGLYYAQFSNAPKVSKAEKRIKKVERRRAKAAAAAPAISLDQGKEQRIYSLFKNIGNQEYDVNTANNFKLEYQNHLHDSALREGGLVPDQSSYDPIIRDCAVDIFLRNDMKKKHDSPKYKYMHSFRSQLPSFKMKQQLIDMINENQVLVIVGETGCGKTTQIPQFILDSYIEAGKGSLCNIICTQPRRISAISIAERVANERSSLCGYNDDVGYQIRLESKMPRKQGSIIFCTIGIILQKLRGNENLSGVSHIIVDEVHERNLDSDFLLITLKSIIQKRKDLKVILMSATLNAEAFSTYFDNCPMVKIPGYTFPVDIYMLEDILEMTGYAPIKQQHGTFMGKMQKSKKFKKVKAEYREKKSEYLETINRKYSKRTINILDQWNDESIDLAFIVAMLRHIGTHGKEGAVLVFLPGWSEINKLNNMLNEDCFFKSGRYLVLVLHSLLPTFNQKQVFDRPPPGTRKIIIATNIAETSITIDDIVYVIDCGKMKVANFDHEANIQSLFAEWIAVSNMKQREGRAGRIQPGICYHMFTHFKQSELETYPKPEMLRSNLEETILKIKILKLGKAASFLNKAMNPPDEKTINLCLQNLRRINAINAEENLTPLGYHLARLPMDPRTGKMILLGAIFSCLDPILSIAASLSFKDAFIVPLGKAFQKQNEFTMNQMKKELAGGSQSDHIVFANVIKEFEVADANHRGQQYCMTHFLCFSTVKMLINLKKQYTEYLKILHFISDDNSKRDTYNINSDNILLLKAIICAGLYPNVAKVRSPKNPPKRFLEGRIFGGKPFCKIRTENNQMAYLHCRSVNSTDWCIKTGWIAFHLKVRSSGVHIYDSTAVTPYSLLFFGGNLEMKTLQGKVEGLDVVSVDNWIDFQCNKQKAELVMNLRKELDSLLEYKINYPGVTNWDPNSREAKVLTCIIELIASEDTLETGDDPLEADDDSELLDDEASTSVM